MSLLDFLNRQSKRRDPFTSQDYYDRHNLDDGNYSPKELARLKDTRELGLGPVRIADGVAISPDGYFSAVLQVGTVNFALATAEEQEAIIGGYHAVLRQLTSSSYQIKVRMVEADLEPLAARVDYALSSYTSAPLHRLALQYKQFLREELPRRLVLMERRNYVIASVSSPLLVKMAAVYERKTRKPCPVFTPLGQQWRATPSSGSGSNHPGQNYAQEGSSGSDKGKTRGKKEKGGGINPVEQRREQLLKSRVQTEMEDKMWEEVEQTLRRLKHELSILVTGLSANGLALHRLNDWELTALYAEYLRPELAQEVRHSLPTHLKTHLHKSDDQAIFLAPAGSYSVPNRPLTLPRFMGEQSGTVVVSDLPQESQSYSEGFSRTKAALANAPSPLGVVEPESSSVVTEETAKPSVESQGARFTAQVQPQTSPAQVTPGLVPGAGARKLQTGRSRSVPVPSFANVTRSSSNNPSAVTKTTTKTEAQSDAEWQSYEE